MKDDIMCIIRDFFNSRISLNHINSTFITLILKTREASTIKDYRAISNVNTIYKIISKLLVVRIGEASPELISKNWNAFVKGRSIADNVLLADELVHGFDQEAP